MLNDVGRDMVFALRMLRRRPGFSLVVVLTLALGIGATTAVFSLADWVLLRPLPGTTGMDRVVTVELRTPEDRLQALSSLNLADIGAGVPAFEAVAGWQLQLVQLATEQGPPVQVFSEAVGGDYFGVLGVQPRLGRGLRSEETHAGARAFVAVISHDLWTSVFGADPAVIGTVIRANRHPVTIVGVAPRGFRGAERTGRIDLWLPGSISAAMRHMSDPAALDGRGAGMFGNWAGRLAEGVTPTAAEAQLGTLLPRLAEAHPEDNAAFATLRTSVFPGAGLSSAARTNLEKAVRLLAWVVVLVLVVVCANVTNLMLFRHVERSGEAAVRRALGASGARLARQRLAEGLILGLAGGVAGLLVAFAIRALFEGTRVQFIELENVRLDGRVFAFALCASLATGALFGLLPGALSPRTDLCAALRRTGARETGRMGIVRPFITVVQLALSLALLVGAILLTRTLLNHYAIEPGYDTSLASFTIDVQPQGYSPERRRAFEDALFAGLLAAPEFERVALTQTPPFAGFYGVNRIVHPATADTVSVVAEWISPGYFETLDAGIIAGRPLRAEDMGAGEGVRNVVVSAALARRLFGGDAALGRTFRLASRTPGELHVVGVAADKRVRNLTGEPELVLYEPYDAPSRLALYITVVIRSSLPLAQTEAALRRVVDTLDPALPFMYVELLSDKLARVMSEQRLFARLLLTLATVAIAIAAVGLYAVVAFTVAARTREIGIRMALGADARRILRMVLREVGTLVAAGIAFGLAGAYFVSRLVEHRLYGVDPLDPLVHLGGAVLFATIALLAAAAPTRSASRVDPLVALRHE